jgi:DNA-binding NarL/FixJ family response regulator
MTIKVLLVDDHRLVREALRDALAQEPDIEVVGEAGDAAGALERADALAPDVVVLDTDLPDLNAIEAASRLKDSAGARIVALSGRADARFVTAMRNAGAAGCVTKFAATGELVLAIRAVAAGHGYLCSTAAASLVSSLRAAGSDYDGGARLSHREAEVLRLIAQGVRSPVIAQHLQIRVGTVEVHRRNIMKKLGRRSIAELTRYAIREGLITS